MQQYKTIYVPVSVKERLPDESIEYAVIDEFGICCGYTFDVPSKRFYDSDGYPVKYIEFWLEKQEGMILCTKEELIKVFYAGQNKGAAMESGFTNSTTPTCQEYLESKGIKP